ncbi:MAG TPA: hypothetical protein VF762_24575 [Blastocatellia bacterium]|jgi:hypothetical protein
MITLRAASIVLYSLVPDPLTAAPDAYKRQFENAWVRVVRTH